MKCVVDQVGVNQEPINPYNQRKGWKALKMFYNNLFVWKKYISLQIDFLKLTRVGWKLVLAFLRIVSLKKTSRLAREYTVD